MENSDKINVEKITTLSYNGLSIFFNFFGTILLYLFPLSYIIFNCNLIGILLFGSFILLIGTEVSYHNLNNLYRFLTKKPAIKLSRKYFIDYTSDKVIAWENIESIYLETRKSRVCLRFHLKDKKVFFRQVKNPITRILMTNLNDIIPIFTNLENIKGKNEDIFSQIKSFRN